MTRRNTDSKPASGAVAEPKFGVERRWIREAAGGDPAVEAEMVRRWEGGEPLQYVLGTWAFREHELRVDRRALIPRSETEWLVEISRQAAPQARRVLDLGTGTGAIALALSTALPAAEVWAVERDPATLSLAAENLAGRRVQLLQGDWFGPLPTELQGSYDLIVSNPPYVTEAEWADLEPVVKDWEPKAALVSGPSGLECFETIIGEAPAWLSAGGMLALECAPHQTSALVAQCADVGLKQAEAHLDLAGRQRVVTAMKPA
jgi:release factor glutamine methyltransferase